MVPDTVTGRFSERSGAALRTLARTGFAIVLCGSWVLAGEQTNHGSGYGTTVRAANTTLSDVTVLPDSEPVVLYDDFVNPGFDATPGWNPDRYSIGFSRSYRPHRDLWVRGDYLLWWTKGASVPPLVTTSAAGTPPPDAGVLGDPRTSILFSEGTLNADARSGGRISLGWWLDPCQIAGIEGSYIGIGTEATGYVAGSDQIPILARPYFDVPSAQQDAFLIAHPNFLEGAIAVDAATDLQMAEIALRHAVMNGCTARMDFLVGYRFAQLDDSLLIRHSSEWVVAQGPIIVGTTKNVFDRFDTQNDFHGAVLGTSALLRRSCWSLELLMKLALGNTHSQVFIDGSTTTSVPGVGSAVAVGGVLAQQTNMGRYGTDDFTMIPEFGITLGCDITCRLRATFGYTFLYWSKVARPGEQIDLDLSQLPPEPLAGPYPALKFTTTDFWAQGMNFGLDYRY